MEEKAVCLVVDDDKTNHLIIKKMLKKLKFEVLQAFNGKEALEIIEVNKVDIVLLDVIMPEMDGFEVCRRIKSNKDKQFIPIIMITALEERDDKLQGIQAGADDFLRKPIDSIELGARVKNLLKLKESFDELNQNCILFKQQVGLANAIYETLVPVKIKEYKNVKIEWFSKVDQWISGDWFNVQFIGENQIGVFLSDAVGHGISATLLSVMLHSIYINSIQECPADKIMDILNNHLCKALGNSGMGLYCTAAFLWIDLEFKTLNYVSAGHPPLIVKDGENTFFLESENGGLPLGIKKDISYKSIQIQNMQQICLYTDGLLDYVNYEMSKLLDLVENHFEGELQKLESELEKINIDHSDDTTVVFIECSKF